MTDTDSTREHAGRYFGYLGELLGKLDYRAIESIVDHLDQVRRSGRTIYCVGNGGSAATALHFATDLSWGRRMSGEERPRATSLTANSPLMTALANDVGYADVFVEQLKGPFLEGDAVFAISASGNSENVLKAVRYANEHGGISIGLAGFDGGKMKSACHACLHVETPAGMYEAVEDVHHAVCHMLSNYLKSKSRNTAVQNGEGR